MDERDPQTYAIIGACYAVHGGKGCGFFEAVYQECLEIEFDFCGIPYEREKEFPLYYRERLLRKKYIADFVCYAEVILGLKALDRLEDIHAAQVINNLKASGSRKGYS